MKPRIAVLALLVGLLLLVGMIPAATAQPVAPEGLVPPEAPRPTQPYRPPVHTPQRFTQPGAAEDQRVPLEEPLDPRLPARRGERQSATNATLPQSFRAGPLLPITAGPERIPGAVLADSSDASFSPSVSADGRYTAFYSTAQNLVPGDKDNHQPDVFVYDNQTGTLDLVSVPQGGGDIWGYFYDPSISDNGRYIAFSGWANDLVPGEVEWSSDIYVLDRNDGSIVRVSDAFDGSEADGYSYDPNISPDGGFVAFRSDATDLVSSGSNGQNQIYLHDIAAGTTERVSVSSGGTEPNDDSYTGSVSLNGEFVSFVSYASNLVNDDTNNAGDIFVRDVSSGTTERVSVGDGTPGEQANYESFTNDISANGRYVAFQSDADNLIATDNNGCSDIFVRDRQTATTFRVSLDENGNEADDCSYDVVLAGDGKTVAMETYAALVNGDANGDGDVYVRNWETGNVTRASVDSGGGDPNNYSYWPAVSADANYLAFVSYADDLVANDENEVADIYLRAMSGGSTTWVSADSIALTDPNDHSYNPDVSSEGRYVVFASRANNLVQEYDVANSDIFLYDRHNNETTLISTAYWGGDAYGNSYLPAISDDGDRIAFLSYDDYIVDDNDTNGVGDIFVYDRSAGSAVRVSVDSAGNESDEYSDTPAISGNGNVVAFYSYADNLVPGDNNGLGDIFVHDLAMGETTRVSVDSAGNEVGDGESYNPALSYDGRYVVFESYSNQLVDNDYNGTSDVYIHDRDTGETTLVSINIWDEAASYESFDPSISADGRYVAFTSYSYDLVPEDENWAYDIFIRDLWLGTTVKLSHAPGGGETDNDSWWPAISADGHYLTFVSWATNIVPGDTNDQLDVFLYDRLTGETARLSESADGDEGNGTSETPAISADGTTVAFSSQASNLGADDNFEFFDIFAVEQAIGDTVYTISGLIQDEGSFPIVGVKVNPVEAPGNFALTDDNGEYTLSVPAGTYDLVASYENYWFTPEMQTLTVGPNRTGIDFVGVNLGSTDAWFIPIEDAYVDQAKKTANYGASPFLRVKNAAADMNAYLKYEVDSLDAEPGQCYDIGYSYLVNHVKEPGPDGGAIYSVDNTWTESEVNWNNAPAISGAPLGSFGAVADETTVWGWIGDAVAGNGTYSFAIRNNSTNSVDFSSKEGQYHPWLYVSYSRDFESRLTADFGWDKGSGLAPLTVQFRDYSNGCPSSWLWEFGDGATSTERAPVHTYTDLGEYDVTLTVTNSQGSETVSYGSIRVVEPPDVFYISPSTNTTIGGIPAQAADILRYVKATNTWTMVYDGSARGTLKNISGFAFDGDDLLLVFSANQAISGLGTATPYDVVRFTPDTPGVFPLGPGTYSWHLQARSKGLTTSGEKIDALDLQYGDVVLSTTGAAAVLTDPVLKAADEDLLAWYPWGNTWYSNLFLDGSTIPGLGAEDINGAWYDESTGDFYITILGTFNLGGVAGNSKSIVRLTWNGSGYSPSLFPWLAPGAPAFPSNIDAIELAR